MSQEKEPIPTAEIDEHTYSTGRSTRMMPQRVHLFDGYILRERLAESRHPMYATEVQVCITNVDGLAENMVSVAHRTVSGNYLPASVMTFNNDGFFVGHGNEEERSTGMPEDALETGYLVGVIDAYDLALAGITKSMETVSL